MSSPTAQRAEYLGFVALHPEAAGPFTKIDAPDMFGAA